MESKGIVFIFIIIILPSWPNTFSCPEGHANFFIYLFVPWTTPGTSERIRRRMPFNFPSDNSSHSSISSSASVTNGNSLVHGGYGLSWVSCYSCGHLYLFPGDTQSSRTYNMDKFMPNGTSSSCCCSSSSTSSSCLQTAKNLNGCVLVYFISAHCGISWSIEIYPRFMPCLSYSKE